MTVSQDEAKDPYTTIVPLPDFDWATAQPLKVRPFKSKYHLTMALENISLSDFIVMDNTFLNRLELRRQLIATHPTSTLLCNNIAIPAVLELYTWMTQTYLPTRFPTIYQLSHTERVLMNTATRTPLPLTPSSPLAALRSLSENIDTDFLFLLPDPATSSDSTPTYILQAFATCFPSGFSTIAKSGLSLSAIHAPVPSYADRLEKSMDRFFARLELGRIVKRANWSISTDDVLFKETGNHLYTSSSSSSSAHSSTSGAPREHDEMQKQRAAVQVEECRLRCERQTLHRLPHTKALVFAFKTYMYTLDERKGRQGGCILAPYSGGNKHDRVDPSDTASGCKGHFSSIRAHATEMSQ
nr:hypothetical protein CFP56_21873 [Quercus suber]